MINYNPRLDRMIWKGQLIAYVQKQYDRNNIVSGCIVLRGGRKVPMAPSKLKMFNELYHSKIQNR